MNISNSNPPDKDIPVGRLQLDRKSGGLVDAPRKTLFLRGPIPMAWLDKAAGLPDKTLNVALALMWLHGMNRGEPFKLTQKALRYLHVSRDACYDGINRLEHGGLISVERQAGQRHTITILDLKEFGDRDQEVSPK